MKKLAEIGINTNAKYTKYDANASRIFSAIPAPKTPLSLVGWVEGRNPTFMPPPTIGWLARTATYTYDDAGRMTGLTQFNGTYTQYSYDDANRLTALDNRLAPAGSSIAAYAYTLDANGNRTASNQTVALGVSATPSNTAYTMNAKKNRLLQAACRSG